MRKQKEYINITKIPPMHVYVFSKFWKDEQLINYGSWLKDMWIFYKNYPDTGKYLPFKMRLFKKISYIELEYITRNFNKKDNKKTKQELSMEFHRKISKSLKKGYIK